MNFETYFAALDPGDIIERLMTTDGTVVTIQHYRNAARDRDGYAWSCSTCRTFGIDGDWSPWHEDYYTEHPERFSRIDHGGKVSIVRINAKIHARKQHGEIQRWLPEWPEGVLRD